MQSQHGFTSFGKGAQKGSIMSIITETRICACGTKIASNSPVCARCARKYGAYKDWPEWLKEWVRSVDAERKADVRHFNLCIFDDEYFFVNDGNE